MRSIFPLILLAAGALGAESPSEQYEGFTGYWLKNDRAEAFAIASPYPRVLAFRLVGGENPLHVSREYEYVGIRTWLFEPTQNRQSGMPALRPATAERMGAHGLRLVAAPDAGWIAYVWNETALKSTVGHVANAEYPENGGTVTMFNSTSEVFDGKPRFGEIENVGPLSELMPGNTLWMEQELELISGIEADDPERWVEILGAVEEE